MNKITANICIKDIKYFILDGKAYVKPNQKVSGDVTIPEKVFYDGISYDVVSIQKSAFRGSNITSVVIPNTLKFLDYSCFSGCSSLENVDLGNSLETIGNCAFFGCNSLKSIEIPDSVTEIGICCFECCSSLENVDLGNSLETIGNRAFCGCNSLKSIEIPDSVTKIASDCFNRCSSLENVYLGNSLEEIPAGCFEDCSNLESIQIPQNISVVNISSFKGASNLANIIIRSKKIRKRGYIGRLNNSYLILPYFANVFIYKGAEVNLGWHNYIQMKDNSLEDGNLQQCAAPTISYENGALHFSSNTEGAKFHYSINSDDVQSNESDDGIVTLEVSYHVTAYAYLDGFRKSEEVTKVINFLCPEVKD